VGGDPGRRRRRKIPVISNEAIPNASEERSVAISPRRRWLSSLWGIAASRETTAPRDDININLEKDAPVNDFSQPATFLGSVFASFQKWNKNTGTSRCNKLIQSER